MTTTLARDAEIAALNDKIERLLSDECKAYRGWEVARRRANHLARRVQELALEREAAMAEMGELVKEGGL